MLSSLCFFTKECVWGSRNAMTLKALVSRMHNLSLASSVFVCLLHFGCVCLLWLFQALEATREAGSDDEDVQEDDHEAPEVMILGYREMSLY